MILNSNFRSNRFGENGLTDACRAVSQNRLLLSLTPSSSVMNNCRLARAAGSSAEGSPRTRPVWRATCDQSRPRRSRPAGSIGLRGGSYCRRPGSVRGWAAGQPGIHHNGKPGLQIRANMTVDCKSAAAQSSHNDAQSMLKFSSPTGTAQRPFQGRWLVLMDPNWFHKSHLAATHRRRTAVPGTNEFQILLNSQLPHEYARIIGHRQPAIWQSSHRETADEPK